jgi:phosphoribosylformylglycinamidine (FGAM) synthase-like amidotransferase family enzyme
LGICNGFQILAHLNAFGENFRCRLAANQQGHFIDRWTNLRVNPESTCLWTEGLTNLELPVRHAEGRVIFQEPDYLDPSHPQIPLRYTEDFNGSSFLSAGVCDPSGRIFGLMPHP